MAAAGESRNPSSKKTPLRRKMTSSLKALERLAMKAPKRLPRRPIAVRVL